jgi:hypothetical protein
VWAYSQFFDNFFNRELFDLYNFEKNKNIFPFFCRNLIFDRFKININFIILINFLHKRRYFIHFLFSHNKKIIYSRSVFFIPLKSNINFKSDFNFTFIFLLILLKSFNKLYLNFKFRIFWLIFFIVMVQKNLFSLTNTFLIFYFFIRIKTHLLICFYFNC